MSNNSKEYLDAFEEESRRFEETYLWLEAHMEQLFFQEVEPDSITLIVHALMGFRVQDFFSEIHLKNGAIVLSLDTPDADVRILEKYPLHGIKNYITHLSTSPPPFPEAKEPLRIAIISFTSAIESVQTPSPREQREQLWSLLHARLPTMKKTQFDHLIERIDPRFLSQMRMDRQVLALECLAGARIQDHCSYEVQVEEDWEEKNSPSIQLVLAWRNVPKHNFLYRLARLVHRHGLVMRRVNATYIDPYTTQSVLLLSLGLHGANGQAAWESAEMADFLQELVTLKYFGSLDPIDALFVQPGLISGNLGNFLRSLMQFVHQVLLQVDPNLYSIEHIEEGLCRIPELTVELCEAFKAKFNPIHQEINRYTEIRDHFIKRVEELDTGHEAHDIRRKNILLQAMNFIHFTLKTNFFKNNKTALVFRLDPHYLDHAPFDRKALFPELPFAIFFAKGMHFIGFHVRFRDLARGGLRTIFPQKRERMLIERNMVFSECYQLALTQQHKNKDIPEGGAKGLIFLKPYERLASEAEIFGNELRNAGFPEEEVEKRVGQFKTEQNREYLYQTQRSFIMNLLTLVNCSDDGRLKAGQIIDYWHKPEYLYLGPDENMHNIMIQWIAAESKRIEYRPKGAFISGKPNLGINHKEYGVTSFGVNVYVEEVLKYLGIEPHKEPFTVKMTGGPDGDVAGNQIHNLYRFYPKTAKLLALTDVSGTIFDPQGLDLEECNKLFVEGKSIRHYPPQKLHEGGLLLDRETKREPSPLVSQTLCWRMQNGEVVADWLSGNEMNALFRLNVHKTPVDLFIPCGGRPRTLRKQNIKDFFDRDGNPTAKAIVEGANLYLTHEAREILQDKGVLIIKDSSANKGGVICSSFEILCSLTLEDEEFVTHKETLVNQILVKLQALALAEAKALLKAHAETNKHLTEISNQLSKQINTFTDQLLVYLQDVTLSDSLSDPLTQCILNHCPALIREEFSKRLLEKLPANHKKAIIATYIASRLVYRRGLTWIPRLVDILPLILQDQKLLEP